MRRSMMCWFLSVAVCASTPTVAQIAAPIQKWAYGGCQPSYCQTGWYSSPAAVDIDGDGRREVISGSYDLVALDGVNGSLRWRAGSTNRIWPAIAAADLDGDGSLEIVVGRDGDEVTAYRLNGTVLWTRHPFGAGEVRSLALADLDRNGTAQVVVGRASGGSTQQVSVYQANGDVRAGWPARHSGEVGDGAGMFNENLAIADLDRDGTLEIYAPTDTHYITALNPNGSQRYVNTLYGVNTTWAEVGVHVDQLADLRGYANCGTEHRPNFANAAPAVADMDGDGSLELVVPGDVYNCAIGDPAGDLYYLPWIFNADRTRWANGLYNWTIIPSPMTGSGPLSQGNYSLIEDAVTNAVLADLDGDGKKEILYASYDGKLHALWLDKTEHYAWPFVVPGSGITFAAEPVVVDLDHDGHAEVIFASYPEKHDNLVGALYVLDYQGRQLHAVPLPAPRGDNWNGAMAAPTLANLDGDPDLELVITTTSSGAVAYDLPGSAYAITQWPTGRGSLKRTGVAFNDRIYGDGFGP